MLEWVVTHGETSWQGYMERHLGRKKGRLGSRGEGPRQGENLGSDGSLVKGLLGVISGVGWWRQQLSWLRVWVLVSRGGSMA